MALKPITFVTGTGAFHGSNTYRPLHEAFGNDFTLITPELPSQDANANFGDDANALAGAIEDADNVYILSHSRFVEAVWRIGDMIDWTKILGIGFINSAGPHAHPTNLRLDQETNLDRYTTQFQEGMRRYSNGFTRVTHETVLKVFMDDVLDPLLRKEMLDDIHPQRPIQDNEPPLIGIPGFVRITSIRNIGDLALNRVRSAVVDVEIFGGNVRLMHGGHDPQIAQPKNLAQLSIELAEEARILRA